MDTSQINREIAEYLALIAAEPNAQPIVRRNGTIHQPKRGWDGAHARSLFGLLAEHVFVLSDRPARRDLLSDHIAVAVSILQRSGRVHSDAADGNAVHYLRKAAKAEAARNSTADDTHMTRSQVSSSQRSRIPLRHSAGEVDDETFALAGISTAFPGDDDHTNRLDAPGGCTETRVEGTAGLQALRVVLATAGLDDEQVDELLTLMMDELDLKPKYAEALRIFQDAPLNDPAAVAAAQQSLIEARGTAAETISGKFQLGAAFGFDKSAWSGAVSLIIGSWTGQPGIASIEDPEAVWTASRFVRARNKLMKGPDRHRK